MDEEATLIGISQLGAVFAGFIAIFLVFARKDGRFSVADSLRIRSLLYGSFIVVIAGVAPLVFDAFEFSGASLWRAAAVTVFLVAAFSIGDSARHHIKMSAADKREVGVIHSILAWGLSSVSGGLLLAAVVGHGGWPFYLLAVAIILVVTMLNFLTITLQRLL